MLKAKKNRSYCIEHKLVGTYMDILTTWIIVCAFFYVNSIENIEIHISPKPNILRSQFKWSIDLQGCMAMAKTGGITQILSTLHMHMQKFV